MLKFKEKFIESFVQHVSDEYSFYWLCGIYRHICWEPFPQNSLNLRKKIDPYVLKVYVYSKVSEENPSPDRSNRSGQYLPYCLKIQEKENSPDNINTAISIAGMILTSEMMVESSLVRLQLFSCNIEGTFPRCRPKRDRVNGGRVRTDHIPSKIHQNTGD